MRKELKKKTEVIKKETMPSPSADAMDTSSQYSSCETLDSHRSSEFDEKNEVNGNDGQRTSRRVRRRSRGSMRNFILNIR